MKKSLLEEFVSNNEVEVISEFAQARMHGGIDITGMVWDGVKWVAIATSQMFKDLGRAMTGGGTATVQTSTTAPTYVPPFTIATQIDSAHTPFGTFYGIRSIYTNH